MFLFENDLQIRTDDNADDNEHSMHKHANEEELGSANLKGPDMDEDVSPVELPDEEMLYDLADLFKVFSDTTRIKILYALMGSNLCVADIAESVAMSQSAVSHQLRILRQARLVKYHKEGKQIVYELSDDHVYTMLSQGMTHISE